MKTSYRIGRIAGIDLNIHVTWLFVFALLAWSLATEMFQKQYNFGTGTSWVLGIVASALLFASVLLHELSHSLVSKRNHMHVEHITLFFFGGVSSVSPEEKGPGVEFRVAIAGPLTSVLLGALFYLAFSFITGAELKAIVEYLSKVNFALAAFNMIPGFPLDGGRVLRSALWSYWKDIRRATKVASFTGQAFGFFLLFVGFMNLLSGGFGIWYLLLGGFLIMLARAGYEQVVVKERLSTVNVEQLARPTSFVQPTISLEEFFQRCEKTNECQGLVRVNTKFFSIDLGNFTRLPREAWKKARVMDLMRPVNAVQAGTDAFQVFYAMRKDNQRIVPVARGKKFLGMVREEDLVNRIKVLSLREGLQE